MKEDKVVNLDPSSIVQHKNPVNVRAELLYQSY